MSVQAQAGIATVEVEKVAALTGPEAPSDMVRPDVCGTDIGTMAEMNGRIYIAFGDTFGFSGGRCSPGPGGPNWRSNVLAITTDEDPQDGIVIDKWITDRHGRATALTQGAHQPAFTGEHGEQTRIPTAMIAVGNRLYLHYMSVHGFAPRGGVWTCNYSRFIYSDDNGRIWQDAEMNFGERGEAFNMLALTREPGGGNEDGEHLYALGTPCGRFGGVRVARVLPKEILDLGAWEYFTGEGWSPDREDAREIIPAPAGEGSILWNPHLDRWLYTYLNENTASLELREAPSPWGPWSEPNTLATAVHFPALYGAYMTPSFLKDSGETLYLVMSQFGPYNTFILKANLHRKTQ
jgi:hypothetical protein